ncbi:MAG: FecR domain-containing protein [Pacificimonas sp.]|jgi:transmembrane sensor|nr:FecR domain-containing protein [Pacificimonas sp.]
MTDARETADEAAARWKARAESGTFSDADRAALDVWLAASADNRAAWNSYAALDEQLDAALEAELLADLETFAAAEEAPPERPVKRPFLWAGGGAAVAASIAAAFALLPVGTASVVTASYETPIGARDSIALSDGSRITLNSGTAIEVAMSDARRRVTLVRGEALFDVARNRDRPFMVEAGETDISVLGTQFDVAVADTGAQVAVLSGVVRVSLPAALGAEAVLLAGERIVSDHDRDRLGPKTRFDPAEVTDWQTGTARFVEAPLSAVIAELNTYREQHIRLGSDDLAALQVTGTFDLDRPGAAVAALEAALPLRAEAEPDGGILLLAQ